MQKEMQGKEGTYKRIRIAGMLSYIPFILAGGAFTGYVVGDFLASKFKTGLFITLLCIGVGIFASIYESIRIIRKALKETNNTKK